MNHKRLRRPCSKCDSMFVPTGKFEKLCEECRASIGTKRKVKNRGKGTLQETYFKSKEELDNLRDNITLKKWKILSKTYKLGKRIWGVKFTRRKLAFDMDMSLTTTLRCLSLDRANKKSWKLVKEKKISVFKLAMVCNLKNKAFQNQLIKIIIEDNLSTYQIKTLKFNGLKDINKERHRLACESGYSKKSSAYDNFKNWTDRGIVFLLMDQSHLPDDKIEDIEDRLKKLKDDIEKYLK